MKRVPYFIIYCLLGALLASGAAAKDKLPDAIVGGWSKRLDRCKLDVADPTGDFLEISQSGLRDDVTVYDVRKWTRKGDAYIGAATVGEEGEGKPRRGSISLRLLANGKLEARRDKGEAETYDRAPGRRAVVAIHDRIISCM